MFLSFRDHLVKIFTDPGNKEATFEVESRGASTQEWYKNQCRHVISMFKVHVFDCESKVVLRDNRQLSIMTCANKRVTTCADNPRDHYGCPKYTIYTQVSNSNPLMLFLRKAVMGVKLWESRPMPVEIIFEYRGGDTFLVGISLENLPIIGTMTLEGDCVAGSCVNIYSNMQKAFEDSVQVESVPQQTGFKIATFISFAIIVVMMLILVMGVIKVMNELHQRPVAIKDAFENSAPFVFSFTGQSSSSSIDGEKGANRGIFGNRCPTV